MTEFQTNEAIKVTYQDVLSAAVAQASSLDEMNAVMDLYKQHKSKMDSEERSSVSMAIGKRFDQLVVEQGREAVKTVSDALVQASSLDEMNAVMDLYKQHKSKMDPAERSSVSMAIGKRYTELGVV